MRLYLTPENDRIIPIASWHQIQDAEAMQRDIAYIGERIPQEQVRIALLGDGAGWIWNALKAVLPQGKQVLDYYHCAEHVHTIAKLHYDDMRQGVEWVETTMARLANNEISSAIWGLQRFDASPSVKTVVTS